MFHKRFFFISGLIFLFSFSANANEDYNLQEVSPGIYYHQGINEDASEVNLGAIANVGFIIGERCVAVVDSGGSYIEGTYLRQAIKKQTDLPICYVINTHVHPDHLLGNAAFKQDKPTYVGHEKLPAALAARKSFYIKAFKRILGKSFAGSEFIPPTLTVKIGQPITLDLGNRLITLTAYPTAHTDNDLTVLDNKTKTLWTGDLLFIKRIPVIDGSINGWIKIIPQLQSLNLNYVIPGHGHACASKDKWQQGFKNELRYLTTLRDEIRVIINNMGTIEQATKTVGIKEKDNWELFDLYNRRNVTASFVELEWD